MSCVLITNRGDTLSIYLKSQAVKSVLILAQMRICVPFAPKKIYSVSDSIDRSATGAFCLLVSFLSPRL